MGNCLTSWHNEWILLTISINLSYSIIKSKAQGIQNNKKENQNNKDNKNNKSIKCKKVKKIIRWKKVKK